MALLWKKTCNLRHPFGFSPPCRSTHIHTRTHSLFVSNTHTYCQNLKKCFFPRSDSQKEKRKLMFLPQEPNHKKKMKIWRAEDRSGEDYIKQNICGNSKNKKLGKYGGQKTPATEEKCILGWKKANCLKNKNQQKKDGKYGGQNIDPLQALQAQCAVEKMDKQQV